MKHVININQLKADEKIIKRIDEEFNIKTIKELVDFSKNVITNKKSYIFREGRNWICIYKNIKIMVNAADYQIVILKHIK